MVAPTNLSEGETRGFDEQSSKTLLAPKKLNLS